MTENLKRELENVEQEIGNIIVISQDDELKQAMSQLKIDIETLHNMIHFLEYQKDRLYMEVLKREVR